MVDIYLYDADSGEIAFVGRGISKSSFKSRAELYHSQGYNIKVVDREDGCVIFTLG